MNIFYFQIPDLLLKILVSFQILIFDIYRQTLSYGGKFKFQITVDTVESTSAVAREMSSPDIFILGNFRLKLHYNRPRSHIADGRSVKTRTFEVVLREVNNKYFRVRFRSLAIIGDFIMFSNFFLIFKDNNYIIKEYF